MPCRTRCGRVNTSTPPGPSSQAAGDAVTAPGAADGPVNAIRDDQSTDILKQATYFKEFSGEDNEHPEDCLAYFLTVAEAASFTEAQRFRVISLKMTKSAAVWMRDLKVSPDWASSTRLPKTLGMPLPANLLKDCQLEIGTNWREISF